MAAITDRSYGILRRVAAGNDLEDAREALSTVGYAVLDVGYTPTELGDFSAAFDAARRRSEEAAGTGKLTIDEHNTIRVAFHHDRRLLALATNQRLLAVIRQTIGDYVVLSQQNGIINPANAAEYNQGAWHRDLPYQHVVFSRPMAIRACLASTILPGERRDACLAGNAQAGRFPILALCPERSTADHSPAWQLHSAGLHDISHGGD